MAKISRRSFLVGCSAAIAGMAGARISYAAFGSPAEEPDQQILVTVFLRGGCDVFSLLPPIAGDDRGYYEAARPDLKIPTGSILTLDSQFGLHPAAPHLHNLYQSGKLAVIQAVGMNEDTRSHFDAMAYMELGTPGSKSETSGWISRHLQSISLPGDLVMPSLSMGNLQPTSMLGYRDNIAASSFNNFNLNIGPWSWRDAQKTTLRQLYNAADTPLHQAGIQTLDAVGIFEANDIDNYSPANGAVYPDSSFGDQLKTIAQMIKLQLGLKVATVDLGGWDTHESQTSHGDSTQGHFADLVAELSQGLSAFYTDLDGCNGVSYTDRLNVVVMTEFGRRLRENADRGTDHGHGGMMLALGGRIKGGLYGTWPGLHTDQLYDRGDLAVTTDYRLILSELLSQRLGNPDTATVFPGFDYGSATPLGIFEETSSPTPPDPPGPYRAYLPVVSKGGQSCT